MARCSVEAKNATAFPACGRVIFHDSSLPLFGGYLVVDSFCSVGVELVDSGAVEESRGSSLSCMFYDGRGEAWLRRREGQAGWGVEAGVRAIITEGAGNRERVVSHVPGRKPGSLRYPNKRQLSLVAYLETFLHHEYDRPRRVLSCLGTTSRDTSPHLHHPKGGVFI